MAIQTIKATIQMRHGLEQDFDADQMVAGEWAVSTDRKYVRMCFAPGIVLRMATYEAFEQDMKEIQTILATCQDIQTAVNAMAKLAERHKNDAASYSRLSESWAHGGTGAREGENADNSEYYSEQAKIYSKAAEKAKEAAEEIVFDGVVPINKGGTGASETNKAANNLYVPSLRPTIKVPGGSDLNDYIVPGTYAVENSSVASTILNSPATAAGYTLFVLSKYGSVNATSYCTQICMMYNLNEFVRYSNSKGEWTEWVKFDYKNIVGNAATADKLKTVRNIALTGAVTGSASFDGSKNLSVPTTLSPSALANNYLVTEAGKVAFDAAMGPDIDRRFNELTSKLSNYVQVVTSSVAISLDANKAAEFKVNFTVPDGYKLLNDTLHFRSGGYIFCSNAYNITQTGASLWLINLADYPASTTGTVSFLCIRE